LFESKRLITSFIPEPAATAGVGLCALAGAATAMTITVASAPTIQRSLIDFFLQ